jgi:hypothetical protein
MRRAASALLLFLILAPGWAEQAAAPPPGAAGAAPAMDLSPPRDGRKQWTVGICAFDVEGLSLENAYLAYSLPLLLKNAVGVLDAHALADAERERAARAAIAREEAAADRAATAARRDLDGLLFKDAVAGKADASARDSAAERLAKAVDRRRFLETLDPARVEVPRSLPVVFKQGTEDGKLLDPPRVPRDAYCAREGIDLLVGGSLQEVQGYLLLDIWAFDATRGGTVYSTRNAAQREDLYAFIADLGREMTGTILGRPWSAVSFAPTPPQSALYVDGTLSASGASSAVYLDPGAHTVRISAPGYRDRERGISLAAGERTVIDDSLEQLAPGEIALASDPSGASVYLGSVWMGVTPLVLAAPPAEGRIELALKGYYGQPLSVSAASPSSLTVTLEAESGPRDARQKKSRDAFYRSLTLFALSVPVPLASYALAQDWQLRYVDLAAAGSWGQAETAQTVSYVTLGTYYAGIAVSVGLFSWMVSRIIDYVKAANAVGGMKEGL